MLKRNTQTGFVLALVCLAAVTGSAGCKVASRAPLYRALLEKNQAQEVIAQTSDALEKNPNNLEARFYRALAQADERYWEKALQDLGMLLTTQQVFPGAYRERARLYLETGQAAEARSDLEHARLGKAKEAALATLWGRLYDLEGNSAAARAAFQEALNGKEAGAGYYAGRHAEFEGDPILMREGYARAVTATGREVLPEKKQEAAGLLAAWEGVTVTARPKPGTAKEWLGLAEKLAEEARAQYAQGLLELGKTPAYQARIAFAHALALAPLDPEIYFQRGRLLLSQNDDVGARSNFERALLLDPGHPGSQRLMAQWLFRHDRPEEALALLDRFLATPGRAPAEREAVQAEQAEIRAQVVNRVLRSAPIQKLHQEIEQAVSEERQEDAMKMLEPHLAKYPEDHVARRWLAEVYYLRGDDRSALAETERVLAKTPDARGARSVRLRALTRLQLWQRAAREARTVIGNSPDDLEALMILAEAQRNLGQWSGAYQAYSAVLSIKPQDYQAKHFQRQMETLLREQGQPLPEPLGTTPTADSGTREKKLTDIEGLIQSGRLAEAQNAYQQLLISNPEDRQALLGRAKLLIRKKDVAAALQDLNRLVRLGGDTNEALLTRARLQMELADWVAAERDLTVYLGQKAGDTAVWILRAQVRQQLGALRPALEDLNQAQMLNPKEALIYYEQGRCHLRLQENQKAIQAFRYFIKIAPSDLKNQLEEARRQLQKMNTQESAGGATEP